MKPFNLKAALAGEPVITRDGRRVTQLKIFEATPRTKTLIGLIQNENYLYWLGTISGRAGADQRNNDLFMASPLPTDETITEENCNEKITEKMMELVELIGNFPDHQIDREAWENLLIYAPDIKLLQKFTRIFAFANDIENVLETKSK